MVESYGIPGAGKSSAVRLSIAKFRAAGLACPTVEQMESTGRFRSPGRFSRNITYARVALFLLGSIVRVPRVCAGALRLVSGLSEIPVGQRILACYGLIKFSHRVELLRRKGADVVILDEGVIQQVWSAFVPGSAPTVGRRFVELIYRGRGPIFVHFDLDEARATERCKSRNHESSYFSSTADPAAFRMLGNAQRFFIGQTERLSREGCEVIRIDGGRPVDQVAASLTAEILAAVDGGSVEPA